MKEGLVIWLLLDGKPGHENQSHGLAEAIQRQVRCETHELRIPAAGGMRSRIRAMKQSSRDLPVPDLIIGAGHSTHWMILWLSRQMGSRSVVLMKPSLPMGLFDLCIAPAHDFPKGCERSNVIQTRGALNRVKAGDHGRDGKLILVGGPSANHGWESAALIGMLAEATDRGGWDLSDSRRTPAGFLDQAKAKVPGVSWFSHRETPESWVPEKLRAANEVWVTEDSVSMIYEALTSGAKVGLLPVPRQKKHSRVIAGVDQLVRDGYLTTFDEWRKSHKLKAPPEPLKEADRCASEILMRFGFGGRD